MLNFLWWATPDSLKLEMPCPHLRSVFQIIVVLHFMAERFLQDFPVPYFYFTSSSIFHLYTKLIFWIYRIQ